MNTPLMMRRLGAGLALSVLHGHHVLRVYCKSLVARMYEKFGTFLRVEICVNRLKDLGLNKGLEQRFILFHKRVCGPLANTLFHHRPMTTSNPPANIEAAYHKADEAIQNLIDLVAA